MSYNNILTDHQKGDRISIKVGVVPILIIASYKVSRLHKLRSYYLKEGVIWRLQDSNVSNSLMIVMK